MALGEMIDRLRTGGRPQTPALPRMLFQRKRSRLLWVKVALPLVAVATAAYLSYRSYYSQSDTRVTVESVDSVPQLDVGMKVSGIAFEGISKKDRPFSVTALSAAETDGNKDIIRLEEPQAEIELSASTWIAVTAEHGVYDRKLDRVDLEGTVTVYHDNGMTFSTEKAAMDLKSNTASGDMPVTGRDARRELSAEGFEMLDDGATVLFKGRSYLRILPKGEGSGE
jgi:lipopolysaccharide export system protein LptC